MKINFEEILISLVVLIVGLYLWETVVKPKVITTDFYNAEAGQPV